MFTLAHLTDPHLGPLPRPRFGDLVGKRLLGYLSWQRRRRFVHGPEVLAALADDLPSIAPDHVVITGDLTNISLPEEHENVGRWLLNLGRPDWITAIPGNHDTYVTMPWQRSMAHWGSYMATDTSRGGTAPPQGRDDFPIVRVRDTVAVIGLNTALPTPPFFASGTLGNRQLSRLADYLEEFGRSGHCRVVLLHHPPHRTGTAWRKHLTDAGPFCDVIAQHGAELILHGHDHVFRTERINSASGDAVVFGIPSASARSPGRKPQAHYQSYAIARDANGWQIDVAIRGFDETEQRFQATKTYRVTLLRD